MTTLQKITKARAGLVLTSPFFASIALRLKLQEDHQCETAYTDSVILGYNPKYIDSLTVEEVRSVIIHEVLHIALLHVFRRNGRIKDKWDMACDYAVNPMIKSAGHVLPENALFSYQYAGLDAEHIYGLLPDDDNKQQGGCVRIGDVRDYKQNQNKQGYESTLSQQLQETKIGLSQAANIAKAEGKMPAELERKIKELMQPKLPWQEILSRFITQHSKNDYNWTKPNNRYLYGDIYLPALNQPSLGSIAVIIDTSGSVDQSELDTFAAELKSILMSYPDTTIDVIYVDSKVAGVQSLDVNNLELQAKGGGGTDFRPGFQYIEKEDINPVCVLYFTDGYCRLFPDREPDYPTLWIITNTRKFEPPFGEVIQTSGGMNDTRY
jgi:predicted metal-dependent peptidase